MAFFQVCLLHARTGPCLQNRQCRRASAWVRYTAGEPEPWMWPQAGKKSCRHALPEGAGACMPSCPGRANLCRERECGRGAGGGLHTDGASLKTGSGGTEDRTIRLFRCMDRYRAICVRDCITSEVPCPWTQQAGPGRLSRRMQKAKTFPV